jgi:hypothetical protein
MRREAPLRPSWQVSSSAIAAISSSLKFWSPRVGPHVACAIVRDTSGLLADIYVFFGTSETKLGEAQSP